MSEERTKAMDDLIAQDADLIDKLRDEDSYYRLQEKHWCIDSEELERQRLAAADRIETQAREIERLKEAIKVQASAVRTLQANEATEINTLRQQKREWYHAVSSLDSEREANAILTTEIERLREALTMIAHHIRDENDHYEEDYWGCRSIARAALAGDSHDQ